MQFSLTILGCNSAIPNSVRNQSAQVLHVHERLFLIDCGEATQLQLRKYHIKFQKITHIFISHLHGDHYFGLIGLISTFHLLGRQNELHIYGNVELEKVIQLQLYISGSELAYPIIFHPLNPDKAEVILDDEKISVETVLLHHKIPTHGFVFKEKQEPNKMKREFIELLNLSIDDIKCIKQGNNFVSAEGKLYTHAELTIPANAPRSYAYCSDTGYSEAIIPAISNVNLLYHEATFMQDRLDAANEKFHSTSIQAATIAKMAGAEKLLIGHYSARYDNVYPMLTECKTVFPNTLLAEDGLKIDI